MKKPLPILLQIPEPCHEGWDQMQPAGDGKFCSRCHKTVIDFTHLTDHKIAQKLTENEGLPLCGRFSKEQLNRALATSQSEKKKSGISLSRASAFLFLLYSVIGNAKTQSVKAAEVTVIASTDTTSHVSNKKSISKVQATRLQKNKAFRKHEANKAEYLTGSLTGYYYEGRKKKNFWSRMRSLFVK